MREMRDEARQLEKNEQELAEKLTGLEEPKNKSLRTNSGREELGKGIEKQRRRSAKARQ